MPSVKIWSEKHGTMADVFELNPKPKKRAASGCSWRTASCAQRRPGNSRPGPGSRATCRLTFLDLDLASRPGRERIFGLQVGEGRADYDLILCDCPPNLQTATQNALFASDYYLVPMQPDFLSSVGLGLLLDFGSRPT